MPDSPRIFSTTLTIQRLMLAIWVGAAVLYVITSVAEQTSDEFDLRVRDVLAALRFPLYYKFGFLIHIVAATMTFLTWRAAPQCCKTRWLIVFSLTLLSGVLMTADYQLIYRPLRELIIVPGQARTPDFERLHTWSKYANEVHVSLAFVAAILSALPVKFVTASPQLSRSAESPSSTNTDQSR